MHQAAGILLEGGMGFTESLVGSPKFDIRRCLVREKIEKALTELGTSFGGADVHLAFNRILALFQTIKISFVYNSLLQCL